MEDFKELVKDITFDVIMYIEDDDSITLSLDPFDIIVNATEKDKAINLLIKDLRELTLEYIEDLNFWMRDINRRKQFKSILNIILTKDDKELKGSFRYKDGMS